jgi:hypothetical protein
VIPQKPSIVYFVTRRLYPNVDFYSGLVYYEHVDELRAQIEAKLKTWGKSLEASPAKAEGAEAAARTLVDRFHAAIQAQVRELRPVLDDLRTRAERPSRKPSV